MSLDNVFVFIYTGDIEELHKIKINSGDLAAFSNDCTGTSKRLTLMKVIVLKSFIYLYIYLKITHSSY